MTDPRRAVPSVDALLRSAPARRAAELFGRPLVKLTLTETLAAARRAAREGTPPPGGDELLAAALQRASSIATGLTPVINATGVVLHTNLGRAPRPARAARAAARAGASYTDLEVDRGTGRRGKRSSRAERLLVALTGAEDALVVNNCAAALLLALAALAKGKRVLVSRGELIEIGGEFRIPEILRGSGARMVEVGTTNRTRAADYRRELDARTGAILRVHPSNYRVVGFTAAPSVAELAGLAARAEVPLIYDVGSGLLADGSGVPDEPSVVGALREGADLVTFSGDKLLGGPQAGCVVGRADLVARLKRHPIARAVRVDAMQIAALEQVLVLHSTGRTADLPIRRMLGERPATVRARAQRISEMIGGDLEGAQVHPTEAVIGGGSAPGTSLPSYGIRLRVPDPNAFAARLRTGSPPVIGRVESGAVVLDARTVADEEVEDLVRAVLYALEGDDLDEG